MSHSAYLLEVKISPVTVFKLLSSGIVPSLNRNLTENPREWLNLHAQFLPQVSEASLLMKHNLNGSLDDTKFFKMDEWCIEVGVGWSVLKLKCKASASSAFYLGVLVCLLGAGRARRQVTHRKWESTALALTALV